MRYLLFLTLVLTGLTGCMSAGRTSDCPYRSLIGKNVHNADLGMIQTQGKELRLLYPDSFLGFDKKPNRVNVIRDDSDEIVAVTCG